jgi:hypothetical protein
MVQRIKSKEESVEYRFYVASPIGNGWVLFFNARAPCWCARVVRTRNEQSPIDPSVGF